MDSTAQIPANIDKIARRLTTTWITNGIDSRSFSRLVRIARVYKFDLDAYAAHIASEIN